MSEAPEEEKKPQGSKAFCIVCGSCAALGLIGTVVFVVSILAITMPVNEAAHRHVELAKGGDVDGAYDSASEAFQGAVTREVFRAFVEDCPVLYGQGADLSVHQQNAQAGVGEVRATSEGPAGRAKVKITLVDEEGVWRVQRVRVVREGEGVEREERVLGAADG